MKGSKLNCPVCGERSCIKGSFADCESVFRKRQCSVCEYIFFTEEYEADMCAQEYRRRLREYNRKAQADYRARKDE